MITAAATFSRVLGEWAASPGPIVALALPAGIYLAGVLRSRVRWPWHRTASFYAGLLVIAIATLSGVDGYDETLLSTHMLQHLLLLDVAPPLLVWGAPIRLAFASLPSGGRRRLARMLQSRAAHLATLPAVGVCVYAGVLVGTHVTGVYELALRDGPVHECEHLAYVLAGLLFFAPIIAADPLPHHPSPIGRIALFTGAMAAMALTGAWLAFGDTVRYPFYLQPARALHVSALADQQLAGVIMIVGGGLTMLALKLVIFARDALAEERRERRRERHLALPAETLVPGGGA